MYDDTIRIQSGIDVDKIRVNNFRSDQFNNSNLDSFMDKIHGLCRYSCNDALHHKISLLKEQLLGIDLVNSSFLVSKMQEINDMLLNINQPMEQLNEIAKSIREVTVAISYVFSNNIFFCYSYNQSKDEKYIEEETANTKIIKEIFSQDKDCDKENSTIITLSPVNEKVLKYLSKNPQAFYQLTNSDFEIVMAEIYNKLGYEVERTQTTRDGGKDIIIRKPDIIGDFIYYVECKKYAAKNHIGVGIVRNLIGTIGTDRVNGGILATTSYFSDGARKFILDNHYGYQIKMHDYNTIRKLLDTVV